MGDSTEAAEKLLYVLEFFDTQVESVNKITLKFEKKGNDEFQGICNRCNATEKSRLKYESLLQKIYDSALEIANIAKVRMERVAIGASVILATAQAVEAGTSKYDTQKKSKDSNLEMIKNNKQENDEYLERTELIRKMIIARVSSEDYLDKLKIEFNGNGDLAKSEQEKRISNLISVKLDLKEQKRDVIDAYEALEGTNYFDKDTMVDGFYAVKEHKIVVTKYDGVTLYHELLHASTRGNEDVTKSAEEIMDKTYDKQGLFKIFKNSDDRYYSKPSERLARLEDFMGELNGSKMFPGIHQYGTEFTQEKYDRMMKLYKKCALSRNAVEFIKRTKPGFENFKKLFEKIAKKENEKSRFNV